MPSLNRPVHFTRSAPIGNSTGELFFYDAVEPSALSRSSVLSCIAEAGGEAKLPDAITVSDFRKWLDAVTETDAEFESRSFTSMCTALKVADAVDDRHIDKWIHIAGKHIVQNALRSSSFKVRQIVLQGLSLLTDHVQHRVFAAATFDPESLHRLLEFLPTRLHASVLAARVTREKLLRMPVGSALIPALQALARLPASPPAVLSLQFDESETCPMRASWLEICEYLVKALRQHAGLTSLLLPSSRISATAQERLYPAIATLSALQSLKIAHSCSSPEGEPTIKQTLQALPQLHSLELRLAVAFMAPPKRPRIPANAAAPAAAPLCLADMLSPATALTCLSLRTPRDGGPRDQERFTAATPLILPQLVQLTADFDRDISLYASLFARLSAPLTSIQLGEELQYPKRIHPAAAPDVQLLLGSLAAFTQLRWLNTTLPTDEEHRSIILQMFITSFDSTLAAFRHLQSFTLAAEPTVVHRSVTLLAPAATALTQLRLGVYHPDEHPFPVRNHSFTESWPVFFRAVSQMKLQHLDVDWEVHRPVSHVHGLSSLRTLTQLTFLRLKGWSCLDSPADGQALARMTLLQHLCLDHPCHHHPEDDFTFGCVGAAALRQLSALTSLTLKTSEGDRELVSALEDEVPSDEHFPALQQLAVSLFDPFNSDAQLVNYAAGLPALKLLTVHLFPSAMPDEEASEGEESEEDDHGHHLHHLDEPRPPALKRLSEVEAELKAAAASAGVELVVNTRAYDVL